MKDLLKSKTFQGGVAQGIATIGAMFGVPIPADAMLAAIGFAWQVYGRIDAKNNPEITSIAGVKLKRKNK